MIMFVILMDSLGVVWDLEIVMEAEMMMEAETGMVAVAVVQVLILLAGLVGIDFGSMPQAEAVEAEPHATQADIFPAVVKIAHVEHVQVYAFQTKEAHAETAEQ